MKVDAKISIRDPIPQLKIVALLRLIRLVGVSLVTSILRWERKSLLTCSYPMSMDHIAKWRQFDCNQVNIILISRSGCPDIWNFVRQVESSIYPDCQIFENGGWHASWLVFYTLQSLFGSNTCACLFRSANCRSVRAFSACVYRC